MKPRSKVQQPGGTPFIKGAVAVSRANDMRGALSLALRMTAAECDELFGSQLDAGQSELRHRVDSSRYSMAPHVLLFKHYEGRGVYVFRMLDEGAQ